MNKSENIAYKLKLYQLRSELLKAGVMQPVKWMIERDLWQDHKNNNNYLSGRIANADFLTALDKLKIQVENDGL